MALHAKNVAVQAGVPDSLQNQTVAFMIARNKINRQAAEAFMQGH